MRKIFLIILLLISLLPASCAGYGKLALQPRGTPRVTPEDLVRTWKEYDVYYAGVASHRVSAVLFDPKQDGKGMAVHPWWVKIEDEMLLLEVMKWSTFDMQFDPAVWRILGPDNSFYAYLYTAWNHALITVADEKTLWIDDMSMPPDYPQSDSRGISLGP